jgi:hypothetical protein
VNLFEHSEKNGKVTRLYCGQKPAVFRNAADSKRITGIQANVLAYILSFWLKWRREYSSTVGNLFTKICQRNFHQHAATHW